MLPSVRRIGGNGSFATAIVASTTFFQRLEEDRSQSCQENRAAQSENGAILTLKIERKASEDSGSGETYSQCRKCPEKKKVQTVGPDRRRSAQKTLIPEPRLDHH